MIRKVAENGMKGRKVLLDILEIAGQWKKGVGLYQKKTA